MVAQKEILYLQSQRAEQAKDQSQDLIIMITKLQKICFPRFRALVGKELNPEVSKPYTLKILKSWTLTQSAEVVHSSLLITNTLFFLEDSEDTSALHDSFLSC